MISSPLFPSLSLFFLLSSHLFLPCLLSSQSYCSLSLFVSLILCNPRFFSLFPFDFSPLRNFWNYENFGIHNSRNYYPLNSTINKVNISINVISFHRFHSLSLSLEARYSLFLSRYAARFAFSLFQNREQTSEIWTDSRENGLFTSHETMFRAIDASPSHFTVFYEPLESRNKRD